MLLDRRAGSRRLRRLCPQHRADAPPPLTPPDPCPTPAALLQVRINGEDPAHDFMPCPGLMGRVAFPTPEDIGGGIVRVDSWVETGTEVREIEGKGGSCIYQLKL